MTLEDFSARNTAPMKTLNFMERDPFAVGLVDERLVQRFAIIMLYYSTAGERWAEDDGWLAPISECQWQGVSCEFSAPFAIKSINLSGNSVEGVLPNTMGLLNKLVEFRFDRNPIGGTLPSQLGLLTNLERLFGYFTLLEGTIPTETGRMTKLSDVRLNGAGLSGPIPSELSQWQLLTRLELDGNTLTGSIPSTICSTGLVTPVVECNIICDCCELVDCTPRPTPRPTTLMPTTLPPTDYPSPSPTTPRFDLLTLLQSRSPNSDFSSVLTPASRALDWMIRDVYSNSLTDDELVQRFGIVALFYTWNLAIFLTEGASECTFPGIGCDENNKVVQLDFRSGNFNNAIPPEIGVLTDLLRMMLPGNGITGKIPNELGKLLLLEKLLLPNNLLTGSIPEAMATMEGLVHLDLENNRLDGGFPNIFRVLFDLVILNLANNDLSGSLAGFLLPRFVVEIYLNDNMFSGQVPDAYGDLERLTTLDVSGNDGITGTIPSTVCDSATDDTVTIDCDKVTLCSCCVCA